MPQTRHRTATIRSSVRPKSSKQPWGTIIQPEFGMGYQQLTNYEVRQTVDRLYYVPDVKERTQQKPHMKPMTRSAVEDMVDRLSKADKNNSVDSNRTQANSIYKNMGVVNSFAWKGYN
ncbi:uncharacterized protein LOC141906047 [Tubulanus polymorphus]|uniref:uncharacterized protein LOC141906047 n=1 Tax=Tubulanus polymorphus TaxID=672921 RepID=UPI003DA4CC57